MTQGRAEELLPEMPADVSTIDTEIGGRLLRFTACAVFVALVVACGEHADRREAGDNGMKSAEQKHPASTGPAATQTAIQLRTFAYDCDDGSYIVAHLDKDVDDITLFLPGQTTRLRRDPWGSGAKYSDGAITFWMKEGEALLEHEGQEAVKCTENRRRSWIEDAKLRGNDYWATGNEPGWTLEIGPDTTVLVTDYGQTRFVFPTPVPQVDREARRRTYRGTAQGVAIVIQLRGEPCHDSMSGESFPTAVEIRIDGERLMGCGLALH